MLRLTESTTVCMVSPQGTKESAFYLACGDGSESCSNEIYGEDFSAWKQKDCYLWVPKTDLSIESDHTC